VQRLEVVGAESIMVTRLGKAQLCVDPAEKIGIPAHSGSEFTERRVQNGDRFAKDRFQVRECDVALGDESAKILYGQAGVCERVRDSDPLESRGRNRPSGLLGCTTPSSASRCTRSRLTPARAASSA
jgi:hypothetical protein